MINVENHASLGCLDRLGQAEIGWDLDPIHMGFHPSEMFFWPTKNPFWMYTGFGFSWPVPCHLTGDPTSRCSSLIFLVMTFLLFDLCHRLLHAQPPSMLVTRPPPNHFATPCSPLVLHHYPHSPRATTLRWCVARGSEASAWHGLGRQADDGEERGGGSNIGPEERSTLHCPCVAAALPSDAHLDSKEGRGTCLDLMKVADGGSQSRV